MLKVQKSIQCLVLLEILLDKVFHSVYNERHEPQILLFHEKVLLVLKLKFFFYVLIHGDTEFRLNILAGAHQAVRLAANFLINPFRTFPGVRIGTVQKVDSQGDRPDIKIFLLDHSHRLEDFTCLDHFPFLRQILCMASKISIRCIWMAIFSFSRTG